MHLVVCVYIKLVYKAHGQGTYLVWLSLARQSMPMAANSSRLGVISAVRGTGTVFPAGSLNLFPFCTRPMWVSWKSYKLTSKSSRWTVAIHQARRHVINDDAP